MKKSLAIAVLLTAGVHLFAMGGKEAAPVAKTELIVSAAASLTEALTECIAAYGKIAPTVTVTPTFGASGSLQAQIEQGAPADLFLSAAPKQMNALEAKGLLADGTRRDLLENKVVLVLPAGTDKRAGTSPNTPVGFADLALPAYRQIALGEPSSVPVGQYSEQIFKSLGILDEVKAKAVYAKDVRQVLAYVESGEVDAGVVYATDAAVSKGVIVGATAPAGSHVPVTYPAAVIKSSAHPSEAAALLAWLGGTEAAAIFAEYGFGIK